MYRVSPGLTMNTVLLLADHSDFMGYNFFKYILKSVELNDVQGPY